MRQLVSGFAVWLALASLCFVPPAGAATVSAADARAVQLVVRAQLDAFADDDAERAFSFATPSIRGMFGTPDNFLQMVRNGYPVVYRPASVTFLKATPDGKEIVQPVRMTDEQGDSWLAVYRVQRQKNKSWRIAGCVVVAERGQTI